MDALAMHLLSTHIGCMDQAANAIVDDQGIIRLHELHYLTDSDVETLCKNVKYLGGVAAGDGGGANLGHMISHWAEMNINLAACWLQYSAKISHLRIGAVVTVSAVRSFVLFKMQKALMMILLHLRSKIKIGPELSMQLMNTFGIHLA